MAPIGHRRGSTIPNVTHRRRRLHQRCTERHVDGRSGGPYDACLTRRRIPGALALARQPSRIRGELMSRFVLLEHRWDGVHWDLMLEAGGVLRTWAMDAPVVRGGTCRRGRWGGTGGIISSTKGRSAGGAAGSRRIESGGLRTLEVWRPEWVQVRLAGARLVGVAELRSEGSGRSDLGPESARAWNFRLGNGIEAPCGWVTSASGRAPPVMEWPARRIWPIWISSCSRFTSSRGCRAWGEGSRSGGPRRPASTRPPDRAPHMGGDPVEDPLGRDGNAPARISPGSGRGRCPRGRAAGRPPR